MFLDVERQLLNIVGDQLGEGRVDGIRTRKLMRDMPFNYQETNKLSDYLV